MKTDPLEFVRPYLRTLDAGFRAGTAPDGTAVLSTPFLFTTGDPVELAVWREGQDLMLSDRGGLLRSLLVSGIDALDAGATRTRVDRAIQKHGAVLDGGTVLSEAGASDAGHAVQALVQTLMDAQAAAAAVARPHEMAVETETYSVVRSILEAADARYRENMRVSGATHRRAARGRWRGVTLFERAAYTTAATLDVIAMIVGLLPGAIQQILHGLAEGLENWARRRAIRTRIEWASLNMPGGGYTWNPIVGCTNGCPYCYARGAAASATRQVSQQTGRPICPDCLTFTPHLHPERLDQPARRKTPSGVFVGSMCDLWDPAVSLEWRGQVWQAMADAPQHRYALLTKRPDCVVFGVDEEFDPWPDTALAVGVSVASVPELWRLSELKRSWAPLLFVSFEPLQGEFRRRDVQEYLTGIDWSIIGAETGKRRGRVVPEWGWVEEIVSACDAVGVPVFLKDNLRPYAPPGYPWRQEWPEVWA
jgi:protein gp37